jgi:HAD superfamily hydrolase (TIGR01509 family)
MTHRLEEKEETLLTHYFSLIDALYAEVKPSQGAHELIQKAKAHHCCIGIVTSNTRERAHRWLERVELLDHIDFIVSSNEVTQGKPHPDPYLLGAKRTGCETKHIIAIEDSPQGAQSAISAGLLTLVIDNKQHHWPPGVKPIESLKEVATLFFVSHR